jgi:photosystem II stability/assembly factor-like uncharacterized protein
MTKQEVKDAIALLLTVPVTLVSKLIDSYNLVLDFFTGSAIDNTIIPDWTALLTFQTDGTGAGKLCLHPDSSGRKRIWETREDNNINHEPPTDPEIIVNTYWQEASPASGSAIKEWEAGVYGNGLIIVFHNHSTLGPGLARLSEPTRPFQSVDIENEITTGKWTWLSVDRSLYQFTHLTDDSDITWNIDSRKLSTALLDTNEVAINLTLQNIIQGTHHTLYVRKQQAGDLVITPLFNSLPVYEVGNNASSTTITLSGAANKLFKLDFARLQVPLGATLVGSTGGATNTHIVAIDEDNLVASMMELIKKSTDGGANWSTVEAAPSGTDLIDDLSHSGTTVLANVRGEQVTLSTDSGDSFNVSATHLGSSNTGQGHVLVVSALVFYQIEADNHRIRKTIDGGATWTQITIPANANNRALYSICRGTTATTIFVGSTIGTIYKSVDAGANWTTCQIINVNFRVKVLQFESDTIGYAASDTGYLYKTINAGASWIQQPIPPAIGDIKEIGIVGASKLIVVGTGGVAFSLDGGALWNLSTDVTNYVSCSVVDEDNIFLLAANGNVYKYVASLTDEVIFVADKNDSVSQEYVDAQILASIEGIRWKSSVKARTTAALPASTVSGANTILTANANGAFPNQDGIAIALNDDILVANEAAQENNGIYELTNAGSAGTPWVLTRRGDANTALKLQNAVVNIDQGTVHADTSWRQDTDSIVLGTSAIVWNDFNITVPDATDAIKGIVELATEAETITGTDTTRAVTPAGVKAYVDNLVSTIIEAEVTILAADIRNSFTSPIVLVDVPPGFIPVLIGPIYTSKDFDTAVFATNTNCRVTVGGQQSDSLSDLMISGTDNHQLVGVNVTANLGAYTGGLDIVFRTLTGNPTGGGSSTVTLKFSYKLIVP